MSKKHAVIIIPTYNEFDTIERTIAAVQKVLKTIKLWRVSILVVDDTSPDKTYQLVEQLQKKQSNLHLVINKQKSGLGGAYLRGMEEAFGKLDADVVFEFDADLSHDPKKIPLFLEKIDQGYDMVLGSRYVSGGGIPDDWGWHRKFLSIVGNLIIMIVLTDFRVRDWTTGYRALTREVYEAVHPELHTQRFSGYTFQIGFLHKAVRQGFAVTEVPFKFVDRTDGESKLGPEYIKNTLLYIFRVRLQEILSSRVAKFAIVGGLGATIQLSSLVLYRALIPDQSQLLSIPGLLVLEGFLLSQFLSIETAIVSNFTFNNLWTFADRKLSLFQIPLKFVSFNVASAGSIVIQLLIAGLGNWLIGLPRLFTIPIISFAIDMGHVYAVSGILLGMFWNFFAYNTFIWKKK